jgi:hypothetical protein
MLFLKEVGPEKKKRKDKINMTSNREYSFPNIVYTFT